MEMDIIYRLSILAGFMLASILAMLIAALAIGLRCWCKATAKELEEMIDELACEEEGRGLDESQNA